MLSNSQLSLEMQAIGYSNSRDADYRGLAYDYDFERSMVEAIAQDGYIHSTETLGDHKPDTKHVDPRHIAVG